MSTYRARDREPWVTAKVAKGIASLLMVVVASSGTQTPRALAAPNLVANSSFEEGSDWSGPAEGWNVPGLPDRGANGPTAAKARTGRYSHEITVPPETSINWYQINQETPAVAGRAFTLSVHLQTQDVRDGAGAYCSINCFDAADKRIDIFDSQVKATGTVLEWRRQSVTATMPRGTTRTLVILTLHGHGTAWFDDAQLEEGETATDYRPSPADLQAAEQAARERKEAEEFLAAARIQAAKRGLVAILRDTLPAEGCASSPEQLGGWLKASGYAVVYLNAVQLSNPFILRGPRFGVSGFGIQDSGLEPHVDLLVLPYGGSFPASASRALRSFLRQDGALFTTGGYALDSPLVSFEGKWYRSADLPMPKTPTVPVLDFDEGPGEGWSLGSDPAGVRPTLTSSAGHVGQGKALQFAVSPMHQWATASTWVAARLPKDWAITRFWAKGDANTPKLAIEWHEKDGSRWKANVPLTTEWKEYVLKLSDFWYWHDNPSVGRGGRDDHLHPEQAEALLIGVAGDIVAADQPHSFWVDDIAVQADPLAALRIPPPCLNTRTAPIRDAMWPKPEQIPLFDPSHRLQWVRSAKAAAGQFVVPAAGQWTGPFDGYSAVGMTSNQGHGFGPNLSRLIPILEGVDRYERYRGPLGAIMHTYDGYYAGASFAFFGVTNKDLFVPEFPQARQLFLNTVECLLRRVYVHDTDTEFSSYRPGETIRLRTRVSNFGQQPVEVQVHLEVCDAAASPSRVIFSERKSLSLKAGTTDQVGAEWKTEPGGPADLYLVRATALLDGKGIDREENGVVLYGDEGGRRSGPMARRDAYFVFGDRPLFALGCQSYWGQNGSVTARSPLAFERDFAMMQDYGLHFSRAFIPFRTDGDRRQSDAIVQLAQKHRVLLYHAPNLPNTADPEELAQQGAQAKALGERYRGAPWVMVDICNEPSLNVSNEKLASAFNEFLRERYQTTDRLRQVWGPEAPEIGQVKVEKLSDRWDDLRSYDTHLFLATVQQRWATHNRTAVLSSDSSRLVSVGFMQGNGSNEVVWDPLIGSQDLDFTDRHYYGAFSGYPAQLKDIDMRALGKPMVQGECGAKEHPTYAKEDPWGMGDSPEKYCQRFLYLVHHAFGLGAAALSSWHWRDPMEGIFPCGLVHSDRVARLAASVMRALAFSLGRLQPKYETPQLLLVTPENHRLGGSRVAVTNALHRTEELLMSCHVDFGLIGEGQLGRLPDSVRALVYPVPYCPSDQTVAALKQFVQKGGALYFSGDISYDSERKLTRSQRLAELAGVERLGERYPNIARDAKKATQLKPRAQWTLPTESSGGLAALPALSVRAATAEVLCTDAKGEPVVTWQRIGQGFVLFCTDPLETAPELGPWHRQLYLEFLRRARIDRNAVQPDGPSLRCFRVPLEDGGRAFVLYNDSDSPVKAAMKAAEEGASLTISLASHSPGLVVVEGNSRLTTVEAQGEVARRGRSLLALTGHVIVQSLDDMDLAKSKRLLLLPFPSTKGLPPEPVAPTTVLLPSLASMRIELGELRETKWHRLETVKADPRGALALDEEQALNMVLAAAPSEFAAAAAELERFARLR